MCRLPYNLGESTSWNPQVLSRSVLINVPGGTEHRTFPSSATEDLLFIFKGYLDLYIMKNYKCSL